MNDLDRFRASLREMHGRVAAFSSPTLMSILSELSRGDVSDQRLRALSRVGSQASSLSRSTLVPGNGGKFAAVIGMRGIATYDLDLEPYAFSSQKLAQSVNQAAADPSISAIVLDINTPGGHVTGTQEAADAVWAARKKKPVIGIVNPLCASAGYWIASQCTRIIGVPSADIGSIGVFMCHYDCSAMLADAGIKPTFIFAGEHKVEGNSMEPLGADAKAWFQTEVNKTYGDFIAAVARGRGTSTATVQKTFGGGRTLIARDAQRTGMIDGIAVPDVAMTQIINGAPIARSVASASAGYHAILEAEQKRQPAPGDRYREILKRESLT